MIHQHRGCGSKLGVVGHRQCQSDRARLQKQYHGKGLEGIVAHNTARARKWSPEMVFGSMRRCHIILQCVGRGRCGMWPETGAELNREVGISAPLKPRDPHLTGRAFVYGVDRVGRSRAARKRCKIEDILSGVNRSVDSTRYDMPPEGGCMLPSQRPLMDRSLNVKAAE